MVFFRRGEPESPALNSKRAAEHTLNMQRRASLDRIGDQYAESLDGNPDGNAVEWPLPTAGAPRAHSHYFKPCPFPHIDVYRVLQLFEVTDPCLQHAVKKLLCSGNRGHKDAAKDVQEAIDSLKRWQEMRKEEQA